MWVLTRSINQYNQDGDYFESVYSSKPTIKELMRFIGCSYSYAKHVRNGGGRIESEDEWYYLTEIKSGEQYIDKHF